jgi:Flp pilus assembly pilin Flp
MRKARERGAALVEMAVIFPLGALLLLGAMQFGWAFYIYNQLEKAVRDAARYAAMRTCYNQSNYLTQVRNIAVCGVPDCTNQQPLAPNLTASQVSAQFIWAGTGASKPDTVVVWVHDYTFPRILMPLRIQQTSSSMGNANLADVKRLRSDFPYMGRYIDPSTPPAK